MKTLLITPESLTVIDTSDLNLTDKKLMFVSSRIRLKGLTLQNITKS